MPTVAHMIWSLIPTAASPFLKLHINIQLPDLNFTSDSKWNCLRSSEWVAMWLQVSNTWNHAMIRLYRMQASIWVHEHFWQCYWQLDLLWYLVETPCHSGITYTLFLCIRLVSTMRSYIILEWWHKYNWHQIGFIILPDMPITSFVKVIAAEVMKPKVFIPCSAAVSCSLKQPDYNNYGFTATGIYTSWPNARTP